MELNLLLNSDPAIMYATMNMLIFEVLQNSFMFKGGEQLQHKLKQFYCWFMIPCD